MGTDHQTASQLGQSLGLGQGIFDLSVANPLCVSSAPTPQQQQEQEVHEAEELRKKEEKAKKLEERKAKTADAKFQKAAVMASLLPELNKWGTALVEKSATALQKALEAIADMRKVSALVVSHGAALKLMEDRYACLAVAHYVDRDKMRCGEAATSELHEREFSKYKMSDPVTELLAQSEMTEPYDKLTDLKSLSFVLLQLANINVSSNAQVKTEKQRHRDMISKYAALITHVSKQTGRISKAVKTYHDNQEKLQKEQQVFVEKEMAAGRNKNSASMSWQILA